MAVRLPEGETLERVVTQFQDAIVRVFVEDYGAKLDEGAFNWVPCDYGPGGKFSLHLIISTHCLQLIFRSNLAHTADPQGAVSGCTSSAMPRLDSRT
jgi:hypothetical protein